MVPLRVQAITNGTQDTSNTYSNVGAFVVLRPDGQLNRICSGTLISPTVFLTAAHCAHFFNDFLAPQGRTAHVSFDKTFGVFAETNLSTTHLIDVLQVIPNPNYVEANSNPFNPVHKSDSGDVAVLILPAGSTTGIAPAILPTLGLLDQLSMKNGLKGAVFTAVGYGFQDRLVGGGLSEFGQENPVWRRFAFSTFSALKVGLLQLSINPVTGNGGDCQDDSGGPNFLWVSGTQILVATNSLGGDSVCGSTSSDYRLDIATARDFLKDYVTLP